MDDARTTARVFRALSVETRVKILQLLKERSLCVNALAARLGVTPAAVSQHLRVLRDTNLLIADKRGYYVHYRVSRKTLTAWKRLAHDLLSAPSE
jgi:DNA-binding transcriptional ArsR family regulator